MPRSFLRITRSPASATRHRPLSRNSWISRAGAVTTCSWLPGSGFVYRVLTSSPGSGLPQRRAGDLPVISGTDCDVLALARRGSGRPSLRTTLRSRTWPAASGLPCSPSGRGGQKRSPGNTGAAAAAATSKPTGNARSAAQILNENLNRLPQIFFACLPLTI